MNTTNVLARVLDIKRWLVTGVTNLLHIELDAKYVVNLLKSSIYTKLLMEPQFLLTTKTLKRWFLMMPKSSPVRCTILALVAVACKREQHRNTFKEHRCGADQTPFEG